MSEGKSIKSSQSLILPSLNISVTSFNPLANIPPHVITLVKKSGQLFLGSVNKCQEVWGTMKKSHTNQTTKLSPKVIENIYNKYSNIFSQYLKIKSCKQFIEVFDHDCDGFLNQDQQISIFSVLKQKMYQTAQNQLKIQNYATFKALMKQVRNLQKLIAQWQDYFRQSIQQNQLMIYQQIGKQRIQDFYQYYDSEFQKLNQLKQNRRRQLDLQYMKYMRELQEKLSRATETLKIKPKRKLKQLQAHQKLVSLQQRVEQALDLRKELNELEKNEKRRVQILNYQNEQNQRKKLIIKHQKQKNQLEVDIYNKVKLDELQNKLIIKMRAAFDVLIKKNKMHQNQIKRIQGLEKKWALKKGIFQPQLRRTKLLLKNQNQIIMQSKLIGIQKKSNKKQQESLDASKSLGATQLFPKGAKAQIQQLLKKGNITTYQLNSKFQSELPVNFKSKAHEIRKTNKIQKYLTGKKKAKHEIIPSLCKMYDSNLNQVNYHIYDRSQQSEQRQRKKTFVMSKISGDRKL